MMRKNRFVPYQAFILAVSVLLFSLACGVTKRETSVVEPDGESLDAAIPAQSKTAPFGEQGDQIALNDSGDIYVVAIGGEGFQPLSGNLMMMFLEGDERVRLLIGNDGILRWSPAWSPEGSQLAFVSGSDDGDGYEIYVVEADGSNVRRLTHENHYNSSPAWSPDGSRIAFVDDTKIYVMEADGSNIYRLTDEHWNDDPTWSPDGSQLAFVSDRGSGGYEIYVMDVTQGSSAYCLTDNDIQEKNLTWSPDGSRIAFEADRDGNEDVYVLEVRGGNVHRLTDDGAADTSPTWSPDGSWIAFSSDRGGDWDIYVMEADGSNVRPLTSDGTGVETLAWRPDGTEITAAVANVSIPATDTPKPAVTPTLLPTPQALTLVNQGFSHSNSNRAIVSFAFVVENHSEELAVEGSPYQVAAIAQDGTVLQTASGKVGLVFPGARLGVVGNVVVPQDTTVAKLDVQIEPGEGTPTKITGDPFVTEQAKYYAHQRAPWVTGIIKNSLAQDVQGASVTAIVFDANDAIIGGGFTSGVSIPAYGQTPVDIYVATTGEPARVELYVVLNRRMLKEASAKESLVVEGVGVIQDPRETYGKFAFVIRNLDPTAVGYVEYSVVAYNQNGQVLTTVRDQIGIIYPGERLGIECDMRLPEGERTNVARLEVQTGQSREPPGMEAFRLTTNPVTVEQVVYIPDPHFPKVTGIVKSLWANDIEGVSVTVIAYDENNVIVGSGRSGASLVPANGQVDVEILMDVVGELDRVEVFATVPNPTSIR